MACNYHRQRHASQLEFLGKTLKNHPQPFSEVGENPARGRASYIMILSNGNITALSLQLPALYLSMAIEIGTTFAGSASDLVHVMRSVTLGPADMYHRAALALECQGFLTGVHPPHADPSLLWKSWSEILPVKEKAPHPLDPFQLGVMTFLSGVQSGTIGTVGVLSRAAKEQSNAFLDGAGHLFPDGIPRSPAFIRSVARAWGRHAEQSAAGDQGGFLAKSCEMGRACAEVLNDHYQLGLAGVLPASRLDASLHVRDIPAFLGAKGWITGIVESLRRNLVSISTEPARIIEYNRASIILHALNSGNLQYIPESVRSVIDPNGFSHSLDASIEEVGHENPAMASLLKCRRNMVISKLLHSGNLKITPETLLGLKGWTEN